MEYVYSFQKNYLYFKFFLFIFSITIIFNPIVILGNSNEGMNFSSSIVIPENQINKSVDYFDLLVSPLDFQELKMTITNLSDKENKIKILPVNAYTNENGIISYSTSEEMVNDSNQVFTHLAEETKIVVLNPLETKEVAMKISLPKEPFKGIILGGFIIKNEEEPSKIESGELRNDFQIIQGVMLRENMDYIPNQFKINDVILGIYQNQLSILTNIQNTSPKLMKGITIQAWLRKKNSENIILEQRSNNINLAPNSNFNYPLVLGEHVLTPGKYTLDISIEFENDKLLFTKDFNVSKNNIYSNKTSIKHKNDLPIPITKIIFLIIFFSLVLLIFYYILMKNLVIK